MFNTYQATLRENRLAWLKKFLNTIPKRSNVKM